MNLRLKKSVILAIPAVIMALAVTACGKSESDEVASEVDFAEFLPSEPEPVIVREEADETDAEKASEEESSQEEAVTPYADRIAGEEPVIYDIVSEVYEEGVAKVTYPQISGMENDELQTKINENIRQIAVSDTQDEGLSAYELSYETATKGSGIASFIFRGYRNYENSAYPVNVVKTININLTTGESLKLKDFADMAGVVSCLENSSGYSILNEGIDMSDFDRFLNNGYMTDYAMLLLDYDTNSSGYSAIRDNHLVLFIEAEHAMGDYVEIEFEGEL